MEICVKNLCFLRRRGIRKGGCRRYGGPRNRDRSMWTPKLWRFYNGWTTPGDLLSALRPSMKPNKSNMKLPTFKQDKKRQKFHKKHALYTSGKPKTKKPYKQAKKSTLPLKNCTLRTNNSKIP
ncbi:hypothetical protein CEXT_374051 [Caerostris extrusa]|uniref:Uncharacterized protein n=1 Tax=Caerostris extrusa TaxID=172846 RepID=A0AAV4Y920_CAEEX|nr:hypothetical protein CEXT_374051 [Caerostris extrusa]